MIFYTAGPNSFGSDQFDYLIDDGHGGRATATVTVKLQVPTRDTMPPPTPLPISPSGGQLFTCTVAPNTFSGLSWEAVIDDQSGVDRYEWTLEQSTSGPRGPYGVVDSGSTGGLSAAPQPSCGLWYRWKVRAVDKAGNASPYSKYANFSIGID